MRSPIRLRINRKKTLGRENEEMRLLAIMTALAICATAYSGETGQNPVEVGNVLWGRDFDAALKMSAASGKPVLVLFQEVPG